VKVVTAPDVPGRKLDPINEMGEEASLQLQMMIDVPDSGPVGTKIPGTGIPAR